MSDEEMAGPLHGRVARPYPETPRACSFPASLPGTGSSEPGPAASTPPG